MFLVIHKLTGITYFVIIVIIFFGVFFSFLKEHSDGLKEIVSLLKENELTGQENSSLEKEKGNDKKSINKRYS